MIKNTLKTTSFVLTSLLLVSTAEAMIDDRDSNNLVSTTVCRLDEAKIGQGITEEKKELLKKYMRVFSYDDGHTWHPAFYEETNRSHFYVSPELYFELYPSPAESLTQFPKVNTVIFISKHDDVDTILDYIDRNRFVIKPSPEATASSSSSAAAASSGINVSPHAKVQKSWEYCPVLKGYPIANRNKRSRHMRHLANVRIETVVESQLFKGYFVTVRNKNGSCSRHFVNTETKPNVGDFFQLNTFPEEHVARQKVMIVGNFSQALGGYYVMLSNREMRLVNSETKPNVGARFGDICSCFYERFDGLYDSEIRE